MSQIEITFSKHNPILIELYEDLASQLFKKIVQRNIDAGGEIWRDPMMYTEDYFQKLCKEVSTKLGWEWIKDEYSLEQTTRMHKDIEEMLDKTESFRNVPGDIQNLIHEAHFCIHQIQYGERTRTPFIQVEWFNDDSKPLPEETVFTNELEFGDVVLQNPYVGHPPVQCFQQNDHKNIHRTCQFHDIIKPGVKINTFEGSVKGYKNFDEYKSWWHTHCNDFVREVGWQKIEKYSGWPKVGHVIDKDNLYNIKYEKEIKLIGIKTHD